MDRKTEDLLDNKTTEELLSVTIRELAKSSNELASARRDLEKAQNRQRFAVLLANRLLEREINGTKSSSKKTPTD